MRYDPFTLTREIEPSRKFEVESQDGETFTFEMRRLGLVGMTAAQDAYDEAVLDYVDGRDGDEPYPFPAVNGQAIQPTKGTLWVASKLATAQVEPVYSLEDFVALAFVREEVVVQLSKQMTDAGFFGPRPVTNQAAPDTAP